MNLGRVADARAAQGLLLVDEARVDARQILPLIVVNQLQLPAGEGDRRHELMAAFGVVVDRLRREPGHTIR